MGGDKPRNWIAPVCLVLALGLAACGSTKVVTTTASNPAETTYKPPPPPVPASYSVTLSGFKEGSHNGSALGLVGINPTTDELCWKFTQLKNVKSPTVARLFRYTPGGTGRHGYLLGHSYKTSGCIHQPAIILGLIESKPEQFFLNIHTAQYPGGAVRGPLG